MEIEEQINPTQTLAIPKSSPIPIFLKKVLDSETETLSDSRRLIVAVHAVFLESGFVAFDAASGTLVADSRFPKQCSSSPVIAARYTLPLLLRPDDGYSTNDTVLLKFLVSDKFISAYACLESKSSELNCLSLETPKFAPSVDFIHRFCEKDEILDETHQRVLFEFWKIVKDGLSTPLLIRLCEKTGLRPPSCFMVLPIELKIRVLELVLGVDLARLGCVCSELRYLASNDELWRKKVEEEFGVSNVAELSQRGSWKQRFGMQWKMRKAVETMREERRRLLPSHHIPRRGHPWFVVPPVGVGGVIGGDYDRLLIPFGARRGRNSLLPPCNLSGFHTT